MIKMKAAVLPVVCIAVLLALPTMAGENKKPDVKVGAAMKGGVDKETGRLRHLTDEEEQILSQQNPDIAAELSKRLGMPEVSVVHEPLANGMTMVQIGLDQLDYLVVSTDADGKPVVAHHSTEQSSAAQEEK